MGDLGYLTWSARMGRDDFRLDGVEYSENCFLSFSAARASAASPLVSLAEVGAVQTPALGGDQPANLRTRVFDVSIDGRDQAEYESLVRVADKKDLIDFMPGIWAVDQWKFSTANTAPTTWRTSRGIWYGNPENTTTYAPTFHKWDGSSYTAWTNVFGSSPSGTQANWPATGSTTPFDIETAAQDETEASSEFWARYMGIFWCQVLSFNEEQPEPNVWTISMQLQEVLIGNYTPLS